MSTAGGRTALLLGLALVAALVWFGIAFDAAHQEVAYRGVLAREGVRTIARVADEGLTRPDVAYAQAWVATPSGTRAFVDLSASSTRVFRLGDELAVVVPPEGSARDVALPVDVVRASPVPVYWQHLRGPAAVVVLVGGCVAAVLTRRPLP